MDLYGAAHRGAAPTKLKIGIRMTMTKRIKKTLLEKIYHFFLKFRMCKCTEPDYEVLRGILSCKNCNKPVKWEAQSK